MSDYPEIGVPVQPSVTSPLPFQSVRYTELPPGQPPGPALAPTPVTGIFPDVQPMIDRLNAVLDQIKPLIPRVEKILGDVDALLTQLGKAGLTITVTPGGGATITVRPTAEVSPPNPFPSPVPPFPKS